MGVSTAKSRNGQLHVRRSLETGRYYCVLIRDRVNIVKMLASTTPAAALKEAQLLLGVK